MTDEHQALNFTITSPGWLLYLKRGGEEQKIYMDKLLNSQNTEMSEAELNYYRGYINGLIWSATWPRREVDYAIQMDREEEQLDTNGGRNEHIAQFGHAGIDYPLEESLSG